MAEQNHATYALNPDGTVGHWLTCGVVTSPLEHLEQIVAPTGSPFGKSGRWVLNYWAWDERSKALKKRVYDALPPFTWKPGVTPVLGAAGIDGKQWRYGAVEEDQIVDFSRFNFTPTLMQGWLFAQVQAEKAVTLRAELLTIGPARVFLNGTLHTHYADEFSYVAIQRVPVELSLKAGENELYLHGEMLGWREARLALGLRCFDAPASLKISLPLGDVSAEAWHRAEAGLNALNVRQFAFPVLPGYIQLDASAPEAFAFDADVSMPVPENIAAQITGLKRPEGAARITLNPGERAELPIVENVTAGMSGMPGENSLHLTLRPADGTPLAIDREIWAGKNTFSRAPYGDYETRRQEALAHLANMPYDVPAALAAIELGRSEPVPSEAIALACHFLENRYDCADFYAIGLLALLNRAPEYIKPDDRERIEAAFRGFKFWLDEPGLDAMCYFTENHQILFHVAAYLAGQLWRDWTFTNSGYSGAQQMQRNRPRIEAWILNRLRGNFSEWDSNAYMTLDAFAMLALVEFAESKRLREMATTLLHKLFFLLACQSFRGAHGSTHGRCYVTGLKSSRVENTSSLQRIAWGMGILNGETRATGLLALARNYRVPEILQKIGADVDSVITTRARSRASFRPQFDMRGDEWDVTTLTYRTPDVMLSAALDYRPGEFGIQEHCWQATLGPEAVVFTTYPGNSQEHGNARPNFWAGSANLPRVGMVDRTVICLYQIDPLVGLGFSHAYFPTAMFDEYVIEGQWAFARSGDGYVALWSDGDLVLTERGRHSGQELRSSGAGEAWICHVGRMADDGDFAAFRAKVTGSAPQVQNNDVQWVTPQGKTMRLGWAGALMVDGVPENWDYPHYANDYTQTPLDAETMSIRYGGETLTLDLAKGRSDESQIS
jgi:hypothetical protein